MTGLTAYLNVQVIYLNDKIRELSLKYGTEGSACADVCANISEPVTLQPGEFRLIGTGFRLNIRNRQIVAKVYPRSGLGSKGIILRNTVGIIDSDYQGEVKLPIVNTSDKPFTIEPYMRIAQIGFFPVFQAAFEEVADFDVTTARGSDGFGSTGH